MYIVLVTVGRYALHSDILSWFKVNQSYLLILKTECLNWKGTNYNFIVFCLTPSGIMYTRGEHVNHYISDAAALIYTKKRTSTLFHFSYIMLYQSFIQRNAHLLSSILATLCYIRYLCDLKVKMYEVNDVFLFLIAVINRVEWFNVVC